MMKITCPYDWICGKEFAADQLSTSDQEFLTNATAKKMTMMFIECPECNVMFSYNTVSGESTASNLINPHQKVKAYKTLKEFNLILKKDKVEIPLKYLDYLRSGKVKAVQEIFKDQEAFKIFNTDELREIVNIDGKPFVAARQLKGYALSLRRVIKDYGKESDFFTLDNLADSITIGDENNRLLFIDSRDNNSLWVFYSDGGDVIEKVNLTLDDVII